MTDGAAAPGRDTATLGIDCGTSAVRAAVVAADGAVLGEGRQRLTGDRRRAGRHEQDPLSWWPAVVAAVRVALARADAPIGAIAVAATSGTLLALDRQHRPCGPALLYDDRRAAGSVPAGPIAPGWDAAGNRPQPSWALHRAGWLVRSGGVPAGGSLAHQGDYLTHLLTGARPVTDTASALKTGVDLIAADWPERELAGWGVDVALLPPVVLPGTPIGWLCPAAAREFGIPAGVVVRAGITDGCAGQIAGGALDPGRWTTVSGSTLVLKGVADEPVRDPAGAVYNHRHPDGGWLPGGASSAGAGYLAATFPAVDLTAAAAVALAHPELAELSFPLLGTGERFPFQHPRARPFDTGPAGSPFAAAAAVQGLAFLERLALDRLAELGAQVAGAVRSTGGTTGNDALCQLRADVLGRPVERTGAAEPAVGVAVLAAAEPGSLAATARRMIAVRDTFEPRPDRADRWDTQFRRFRGELERRGWLPTGPHTPGPAVRALPAVAR